MWIRCGSKNMRTATTTTHVCCMLFLIFNLESVHCHGNHRHHSRPSLSKSVDETSRGNDEGVNDHHSGEIPDHRYFLTELFSKYGHNGVMSFEGFEHLLESLQLGGIIIKDHDLSAHRERDNVFTNNHADHKHRPTPKGGLASPTEATHHSHNDHDHDHGNQEESSGEEVHSQEHDHETQLLAELQETEHNNSGAGVWHYMPEFLTNLTSFFQQHLEFAHQDDGVVIVKEQGCLTASEILHTFNIKNQISPMGFLHLCPAIIYELDRRHCSPSAYHLEDQVASTSDVWLYSSLAVIVISLCGLLSVAVIPIMQKVFYQTLLQFLVGLAIGSLSGDALLHLLPHALSSSREHQHREEASREEEAMVWRGLVALGGVYTFFVAERLLNAFASYRRKKASEKKFRSSKVIASGNEKRQLKIGEKLSGHRKPSYNTDREEKEELQNILPALNDAAVFEKLQQFEIDPRGDEKNERPSDHEIFHRESVVYRHTDDDDSFTVQLPDHHGHGHTHEIPATVSAVAMMVIMGDGLHNFCDGLAIGAAFTSGISGGLSTSVAVFCHELPHELGDFAMLLKTGMSAKQALLYNGLSSILCFIGMAIGIALGNLTSATHWIFAVTAGMFIYIALVDMLPELESDSKNKGRRLAIQVLGISTGISIMLLIAIYEHDLKHIIS